MGLFEWYKPAQGKHTRRITLVAGAIIAVAGGYWLSERLSVMNNPFVQYLLPLGLVLGLVYVLYRLVNRPKMADFLIATEGEMKKVAWSSRTEVIGSTKVVIFTTFLLAVALYVVDLLFSKFFGKIGVLEL